MLEYLKQKTNETYTENGALTYKSTLSHCLDFFATAGAVRHKDDAAIETLFMKAFAEDKNLAMKLLFYARDVRGGLGERRVFRTALKRLANICGDSVKKNIEYIPEYGRYDDLLELIDTPLEEDVLKYIKGALDEDIRIMAEGGNVSLLGKWLPSINASNKVTVRRAKKIARFMGMTYEEYRKTVTKLRKEIRIIENNLREKDYTFDYSKQPSRAMFKYRRAFMRNDHERYMAYLDGVSRGGKKLNASHVEPYELVDPLLSGGWDSFSVINGLTEEQKKSLNVTWESLPDYGTKDNALAVVDNSGSMYCWRSPRPAAVALSLGMYFAEHNTGAFKGHFIEFSEKPQLIEIKGETFIERLRYVMSFSEVANTNVQAVFDLVLQTALEYNVSQEEMPSRLIIISDMEFDYCTEGASVTNFQYAKKAFESRGYKLPQVVFWNVASRNMNQPVTVNEKGVILVSGCTPRIFSMITSGDMKNITPYDMMMEIICGNRYELITA